VALLCILNSDFIWFYIGGSILLYQTFIYPHILKAYGPINASRIATVSTNYHSTTFQCSFWPKRNHNCDYFCRFYLWCFFLLIHLWRIYQELGYL